MKPSRFSIMQSRYLHKQTKRLRRDIGYTFPGNAKRSRPVSLITVTGSHQNVVALKPWQRNDYLLKYGICYFARTVFMLKVILSS